MFQINNNRDRYELIIRDMIAGSSQLTDDLTENGILDKYVDRILEYLETFPCPYLKDAHLKDLELVIKKAIDLNVNSGTEELNPINAAFVWCKTPEGKDYWDRFNMIGWGRN